MGSELCFSTLEVQYLQQRLRPVFQNIRASPLCCRDSLWAPLPTSDPLFFTSHAQVCTAMPAAASDVSAAVVETQLSRPCTDVPGQGSYETRLHAYPLNST